MANLNILEQLRTRKEVEDYLKQLGKEITEEELDALKQSYDQAQESSGALTMQQLDDVAGGLLLVKVKIIGTEHLSLSDPKLCKKDRSFILEYVSNSIEHWWNEANRDKSLSSAFLGHRSMPYYSFERTGDAYKTYYSDIDHILAINDGSKELTIKSTEAVLESFDTNLQHIAYSRNVFFQWPLSLDTIKQVNGYLQLHYWNNMTPEDARDTVVRGSLRKFLTCEHPELYHISENGHLQLHDWKDMTPEDARDTVEKAKGVFTFMYEKEKDSTLKAILQDNLIEPINKFLIEMGSITSHDTLPEPVTASV